MAPLHSSCLPTPKDYAGLTAFYTAFLAYEATQAVMKDGGNMGVAFSQCVKNTHKQ